MSEITFPDNTTYESDYVNNVYGCAHCDLKNTPHKCNSAIDQSSGCFNIVWKLKENTEIQEELKAIEAYIQAIHDKYKEEPKYKHYFKDVSHLEAIDVYRVLDLWNVTHPCLQHALKKILVAGDRGYKDVAKDIQEAIDSLIRWREMQKENL